LSLDDQVIRYRIPTGNVEARRCLEEIRRSRAAVVAMLRGMGPPKTAALFEDLNFELPDKYHKARSPKPSEKRSLTVDDSPMLRAALESQGWEMRQRAMNWSARSRV
jgi:hypothetical protein